MLKKIGLSTVALIATLVLLAPAPARAEVRFGVTIGTPAYAYPTYVDPYPYADYYAYPAPTYVYPAPRYVAPSYSYTWRDHDRREWREHERHEWHERMEHRRDRDDRRWRR